MVFGIHSNQKLQNDVFCLTEERDYFQEKFLSQVSEIAFLKDELGQAKKEINKLRTEILQGQVPVQVQLQVPPHKQQKQPRPEPEQELDQSTSSLTSHDEEEEDEDEEDDDEKEDDQDPQSKESQPEELSDEQDLRNIRQSAEKLLQWASYRSSVRTPTSTPTSTPDHSSVASPSQQDQLLQVNVNDNVNDIASGNGNMLGPISSDIASFDQEEDENGDAPEEASANASGVQVLSLKDENAKDEHEHEQPSSLTNSTTKLENKSITMLEKFDGLAT
jgi:hypothetical protein